MDPSKSNGSGGGEFPTAEGWKKFEAPPTFLQVEEQLKTMMPTDQIKFNYVINKLQQLSKNAQSKAESDQYAYLIAQINADRLSGQCTEDFIEDFFLFIQGRSKYNVVEKRVKYNPNGTRVENFSKKVTCPWGPKPFTHLFDVKDFMDSMVDQRASVMKYISNLKLRWPRNITELWIWYKYISREQGVDGFLVNYARFLEPYDFLPPEKVPFNPVDNSHTYIYKGNMFSPEVKAFTINNPNPPVYNDGRTHRFLTLLQTLINDPATGLATFNLPGGLDPAAIPANTKDKLDGWVALMEMSYDIPPELISNTFDQIEQSLFALKATRVAAGDVPGAEAVDAVLQHLELGQFKPQTDEEILTSLVRDRQQNVAAGNVVLDLAPLDLTMQNMQNGIALVLQNLDVQLNNFGDIANNFSTNVVNSVNALGDRIDAALRPSIPNDNIRIPDAIIDIRDALQGGQGGQPPPGGGGGGGGGQPPPAPGGQPPPAQGPPNPPQPPPNQPPGGGGQPQPGNPHNNPPDPGLVNQIRKLGREIKRLKKSTSKSTHNLNITTGKLDKTLDGLGTALTSLNAQVKSVGSLYDDLTNKVTTLAGNSNDAVRQILDDTAVHYKAIVSDHSKMIKQLTDVVDRITTPPPGKQASPPTTPKRSSKQQPPPSPSGGSAMTVQQYTDRIKKLGDELTVHKKTTKSLLKKIRDSGFNSKRIKGGLTAEEQALLGTNPTTPKKQAKGSSNIIAPSQSLILSDDEDEDLLKAQQEVSALKQQMADLQTNFDTEKNQHLQNIQTATAANNTLNSQLQQLKKDKDDLIAKHTQDIQTLIAQYAAQIQLDKQALMDQYKATLDAQLQAVQTNSVQAQNELNQKIADLERKLAGPYGIKVDDNIQKPLRGYVQDSDKDAIRALGEAQIMGGINPKDNPVIWQFFQNARTDAKTTMRTLYDELLSLESEVTQVNKGSMEPHRKRLLNMGMNPANYVIRGTARANYLSSVITNFGNMILNNGIVAQKDYDDYWTDMHDFRTLRSAVYGTPMTPEQYKRLDEILRKNANPQTANTLMEHFESYYTNVRNIHENGTITYDPRQAARIIVHQKKQNEQNMDNYDKFNPYYQYLLAARDFAIGNPQYAHMMLEEFSPFNARTRSNLITHENGELVFSPINGIHENIMNWADSELAKSASAQEQIQNMQNNASSRQNRVQVEENVQLADQVQNIIIQGDESIMTVEKLTELERLLKENIRQMSKMVVPNPSAKVNKMAQILPMVYSNNKKPYLRELIQNAQGYEGYDAKAKGFAQSQSDRYQSQMLPHLMQFADSHNMSPSVVALKSLRSDVKLNHFAKNGNKDPKQVKEFVQDLVEFRGVTASQDQLKPEILQYLQQQVPDSAPNQMGLLMSEIGFLIESFAGSDKSEAAIKEIVDNLIVGEEEKEVLKKFTGSLKKIKQAKNLVDSTLEIAKNNFSRGNYVRDDNIDVLPNDVKLEEDAFSMSASAAYLRSLQNISNTLGASYEKYSELQEYSVEAGKAMVQSMSETKKASDLALMASMNYLQKNVVEKGSDEIEQQMTPLYKQTPSSKKKVAKKSKLQTVISKRGELPRITDASGRAARIVEDVELMMDIAAKQRDRRKSIKSAVEHNQEYRPSDRYGQPIKLFGF